jgi:outer membrane protein assembly factor BamB
LTPPAAVNGKLFVGTAAGEVLCLSADKGERLWSANVGEPVVFQPAVARGRVYVATSAGSLICLETGDAKDDGWLMWGGSAAHNGAAK